MLELRFKMQSVSDDDVHKSTQLLYQQTMEVNYNTMQYKYLRHQISLLNGSEGSSNSVNKISWQLTSGRLSHKNSSYVVVVVVVIAE